jgi:carboxymethylenebutenolidase
MAQFQPGDGPDLGSVFDEHVRLEFVDKDVDAVMKTMVEEPYVWNVATATGGIGRDGVWSFYTEKFVGKMPDDTKVSPISRTVGQDQVVDELLLTFTHDRPIEFMLPGVPATGRYVELPHVVVMKFKDGKIVHEHIYWDQASLLVQVGLLDPAKLPAVGGDQASRLLDLSRGGFT